MGTTRQKCHSHGRVMSADRTVLDSYRAEKSDVIDDVELEVLVTNGSYYTGLIELRVIRYFKLFIRLFKLFSL